MGKTHCMDAISFLASRGMKRGNFPYCGIPKGKKPFGGVWGRAPIKCVS